MISINERIARLGIWRQNAVEPVPHWQYKLRQAEMARDAADARIEQLSNLLAQVGEIADSARCSMEERR